MKKIVLSLIICFGAVAFAQAQTTAADSIAIYGKVTVTKDSRFELLEKKEAEINEALANAPRIGRGYRLMVLSTNDRALAMKVRTQLLQDFPEQKVYMSFQPPYIKIRFGNFVERSDAENYQKEIAKAKMVSSNIYIVSENIEIRPDKTKDKELSQ